ncbi:two-component system, NarL family, nitrate/nitrite sensor histidine kinase NarX [Andreprevotia lacus DSM 23236]|jgi:two-component system nitrate/nitrite sensor histidine kinase NarX|uniref:Sensor protein n=1 Tax=Andreprevotia lacus DSM 23236 TaxID=1121001 RepID=A0A1W1XWU5_9NEIS|nr:type IV pili methyl-accepting chemotaxis transducer N-terminal domain-containing protein [Andreprevotia lacus]SMC28413.1 two-component system, NarL family, nitrate/nitrite sensor histidine kinase NarX [Andreprevotia lacus DSM 23236]
MSADSDGLGVTPPSPRESLSARIVISSLVALLGVLAMIGWTLWLSWQLEGAGAAINDAGSLRMRANRIGLELLRTDSGHTQRIQLDLSAQTDTLARLQTGVPSRPLFLPDDPAILAQMGKVRTLWTSTLQPAASRALAGTDRDSYLQALQPFVDQANQLVQMIEADNAGKTTLLRLSQAVLAVIAFLGTLAMIYLLYMWIVAPVLRLQHGLQRMAEREFSVRLPVESRDEFGVLAQGFNNMADTLEGLYRDLGERVQEKTAQLAQQNRELSLLYGMTAFLNQPLDIETLCQGFLQRVMQQFNADGGSIRVLDPTGEKLHLVVSEGLTESLEEAEHCMRVHACYCGEATQQGAVVIRDFRKLANPEALQCANAGFRGLAVFRVATHDEVLGSFSLHFRNTHAVPAAEAQLLDALGQHLGVALVNRRLGAKARQLAVAEERNLVAQGLHDSIAQGLNFLNLQVQMLDSAVQRERWAEVREVVPLLRTGVDESYQDVRELLVNFRSKLGQGELIAAIEDTVARFKRQSGVAVSLHVEDAAGQPLPSEEQLQVLFILQEALSNVRKHAHASAVDVEISNQRDFRMRISDDGDGYDPAEVAERDTPHVGLHIMHERADRLNAQLTMTSRPGGGTRVELVLPSSERRAA